MYSFMTMDLENELCFYYVCMELFIKYYSKIAHFIVKLLLLKEKWIRKKNNCQCPLIGINNGARITIGDIFGMFSIRPNVFFSFRKSNIGCHANNRDYTI